MRKRSILLVLSALITVVSMYGYFKLQEAKVAYRLIEIPEIASYQFVKAIYGENDHLLKNPIDLAAGNDGTIYVTDTDHNRIQVFTPAGEFKYQFGKQGNKEGELDYPAGIVVDSKENVYVAEVLNQRISVFDSQGKFLRFLTSREQNPVVRSPTAIAIDSEDRIYVIDKWDHKIKKLSTDGKLLFTLGGLGQAKGKFQYPLGLAVNARGDIAVSDTGNSRVQVFDPEGRLLTVISGYFDTPSGIATDHENNLYIADPVNGRIVVTKNRGEQKGMIGEMGVTPESLYIPEGIMIRKDHLYIADKGNSRVVIYRIRYKNGPESR